MDTTRDSINDGIIDEDEGHLPPKVTKPPVAPLPEAPPAGIRFLTGFIEGNYFYVLSALLMMSGCYLLQQTTDTEATFEYDLKALLILQGYEFLLIATAILIFRRLKILGDVFTLLALELVLLLDPTFFTNAFFTINRMPNFTPPFDMVWVNAACFALVPVKLLLLSRMLRLSLSLRTLAAFAFAGAVVYLGEGPLNDQGQALSRYDYYYILGWTPALLALLLPPLARMVRFEHIAPGVLAPRQQVWLPRLLLLLPLAAVLAHYFESAFVYLSAYQPLYVVPILVAACVLIISNTVRGKGGEERVYYLDALLLVAAFLSFPDANPTGKLLQETRLLTPPSFVITVWPFVIFGLAAAGLYAWFYQKLQHRPALYRIGLLLIAAIVYGTIQTGLAGQAARALGQVITQAGLILKSHPTIIVIPIYIMLLALAYRVQRYATWFLAGAYTIFLFFFLSGISASNWVNEIIQAIALLMLVLGHVFRMRRDEVPILSGLVVFTALVRLSMAHTFWAGTLMAVEAAAFIIAGWKLRERAYMGAGLFQAASLAVYLCWMSRLRISPAHAIMAGGLLLFAIGVFVTFYKTAILRWLHARAEAQAARESALLFESNIITESRKRQSHAGCLFLESLHSFWLSCGLSVRSVMADTANRAQKSQRRNPRCAISPSPWRPIILITTSTPMLHWAKSGHLSFPRQQTRLRWDIPRVL